MSTSFKMKGFSGFGNSPLRQDITKVSKNQKKINISNKTSEVKTDDKGRNYVLNESDTILIPSNISKNNNRLTSGDYYGKKVGEKTYKINIEE